MKILHRLMSDMGALVVLAVLGTILLMTGPAQAIDFTFAKLQKPRPIYVADEVLVKFKSTATSQARSQLSNSLASVSTKAIGKTGAVLLKLSGAHTVEQAVAAAQFDPNVEYAQPNYLYYASIVPNDLNYGQLWGLKNTAQTISDPSYGTNNPGTVGKDISAEAAWDHITDCSAVVVAVLDTGINYTHQDLVANMWDGGATFPNHGTDFIDDDKDPMPLIGSESHGTHVAGTIGASGNNGIGTTGVCWQARIMSVRVLGPNGGTTVGIVQGIEFASDNGARVINMSLSGDGPFDQAFSDGITYAQDRDVVVVVAAGNETNDNDGAIKVWPCNFTHDNLICVAALDQAYQLADFSNFGTTSVDVGAPGTNVMSTYPGPVIEDDFSSGWTVAIVTGTPWASVSCDFGSGLFPMMVNPSDWCPPTSLYSDNTLARVFKAFDLSSASAASASYAAFYDVEANFDFFRDAAFGGGNNPFLDPSNVINVFTGSTLPFAPFVETDLSGCLTSTCSVGFELESNNTNPASGVGILVFEIGTVQPNSNAYNTIDGTSMASPHVAGLAALVRAFNPNYTFTDTVNAIKNGGVDTPALSVITTTGKAVDALGSLAFINAPEGVVAVVQ